MKGGKLIIRDALIIVGSVIVAILLTRFGVLNFFVDSTKDYYPIGTFLTGIFFTSIFTTVPAIAVLASLGAVHSPLMIALFGAMGALCGDIIMFHFIEEDISADVDFVLSKAKSKRLRHIIHLKAFRWFLTSLGALIIASPLPDELGLALMGISRISLATFIPISLVFNFVGIYVIAVLARLI